MEIMTMKCRGSFCTIHKGDIFYYDQSSEKIYCQRCGTERQSEEMLQLDEGVYAINKDYSAEWLKITPSSRNKEDLCLCYVEDVSLLFIADMFFTMTAFLKRYTAKAAEKSM